MIKELKNYDNIHLGIYKNENPSLFPEEVNVKRPKFKILPLG